MGPGSRRYSEGSIVPKQFGAEMWAVWCQTGALSVLQRRDFAKVLADRPSVQCIVNFANGSAARIRPGHPLWRELAEIAETYTVEVFPLRLNGAVYVPWTGAAGDLSAFDAIRISNRTS